jgi:predicted GIY-YIG superfamily endonuclease
MKYHVYELVDATTGDVVYVGQTKRPKLRFAEHTKYDYPSRPAIFKDEDVEFRVVAVYDTKIEALNHEDMLKQQYNMERPERGNRTWIRKMTFEQAEEMRRLYATGDYTYGDLCEMFPVKSTNSAWRIVNHKTYTS